MLEKVMIYVWTYSYFGVHTCRKKKWKQAHAWDVLTLEEMLIHIQQSIGRGFQHCAADPKLQRKL